MPSNIHRLTIAFSMSQIRWLTEQAEARACTASEVVRRVIDEARGDRISRSGEVSGRASDPSVSSRREARGSAP